MKLRSFIPWLTVLLVHPQVSGATELPLQMGPAGDYLLKSMLLLAALLGMLFVALKVLRRMGHLKTGGGNRLRIVEGISLGGQERAVLLKVGDEEILVGVSQGRIAPLLTVNGSTDTGPTSAGGKTDRDFDQLLHAETGAT